MRKTQEILRLKFDARLSNRQIATSCRVSPASVWSCLNRFSASQLPWPLPPGLSDEELERKLYQGREEDAGHTKREPDWGMIRREMRKKHVTMMLLWQEYKQTEPDGYQYSRFCEKYAAYCKHIDVVMRQDHRLGEKGFVDYAGDTIEIIDPHTGEVLEAQLFVGVLGASNFTYAEASWKQDVPSWIGSHVRMFEYWGGVPAVLVPDNLKSGVTKPDYYEPDINPTYQEMAEHYKCAVIPARVRKPRDKAKVETGVQIAERRILAALRNRTFYSLQEVNQAIREQVDLLNDKPFQKLPGSRRSVFEQEERSNLQPLPREPYRYADRKVGRVHIDYHVEVDGHYYSTPYRLVGESVEMRWTSTTVEVFHKGVRVASHVRSYLKGKATTLAEHMPPKHRKMAEWTPERIIAWAGKIGMWTARLVKEIMAHKQHPELGFRSCLGIMRLSNKYGEQRVEAACRRAVVMGAYSYRSVKSILDNGLDQQDLPVVDSTKPRGTHENVRGPEYYHGGNEPC